MAVKEVPKTYVYTCDHCKAETVLPDRRPYPIDWMHVSVKYDGEWHDPSYERLFCKSCKTFMKIVIEVP